MTLLGSAAKYAHQILKGEKFYLVVIFAQLLIAAFGGLLIILLANHYHWPAEIMGVAAGLDGWSWAEVIDFLDKKFWYKS
jgi:hypothetical protein